MKTTTRRLIAVGLWITCGAAFALTLGMVSGLAESFEFEDIILVPLVAFTGAITVMALNIAAVETWKK